MSTNKEGCNLITDCSLTFYKVTYSLTLIEISRKDIAPQNITDNISLRTVAPCCAHISTTRPVNPVRIFSYSPME